MNNEEIKKRIFEICKKNNYESVKEAYGVEPKNNKAEGQWILFNQISKNAIDLALAEKDKELSKWKEHSESQEKTIFEQQSEIYKLDKKLKELFSEIREGLEKLHSYKNFNSELDYEEWRKFWEELKDNHGGNVE